MAKEQEKEKEFEFQVDGEPVDLDDLTFRELSEYRKEVRGLADDRELDVTFAAAMDRWPVLVWLIRRRKNPDYTLDEVLESMKPADVLVEKRPTRARKAPAPAKT